VPDDGSREPKHVALCGVTVKCCVGSIFSFMIQKHNGMHQNKIVILLFHLKTDHKDRSYEMYISIV